MKNFDKIIKVIGVDIVLTDLEIMLKDLSPRYRKVLELRYGLIDGISHTLEELGKEFGVTRERIRQIESKAFDLLRNHNLTK